MFSSTARLLSRRRISVLAATLALGTTGAMMLGSASASAAVTSPAARPVQNGPGIFTQTTTVNVPATTAPAAPGAPGVDTGVNLVPGEAAVITATGIAGCNYDNPACIAGPNGDDTGTDFAPFLDPRAPAHSLVGKVGNGPLTFIGAGPTMVQGHGELRLGYNDALGDYYDNSGGFTATIQTCSLSGIPILGLPLCALLGPTAA